MITFHMKNIICNVRTIIFPLIIILSNCHRQSIDIIESYTGIDIPVNCKLIKFRLNFKDKENYIIYIEIEFDDTNYFKLFRNINESILYNEVFDSTNREEIKETLIKVHLTSYWIVTDKGYLFFEPPFGKYPNSVILLEDTFFLKTFTIDSTFKLYYRFEKFKINQKDLK